MSSLGEKIDPVILFQYNRNSHQRCSIKKGVLKTFEELTEKDLCQSLFLIKLQAGGLQLYLKRECGTPATLLKKDSDTGVFL